MLRFILLAILLMLIARAFWRLFDSVMESAGRKPGAGRKQPAAVKLVRDPVCGTFVAPASARFLTTGGGTQYFCSDKCRDAYTSPGA